MKKITVIIISFVFLASCNDKDKPLPVVISKPFSLFCGNIKSDCDNKTSIRVCNHIRDDIIRYKYDYISTYRNEYKKSQVGINCYRYAQIYTSLSLEILHRDGSEFDFVKTEKCYRHAKIAAKELSRLCLSNIK